MKQGKRKLQGQLRGTLSLLSYVGVMMQFASSVFFLTIPAFVFFPEEASLLRFFLVPGVLMFLGGLMLFLLFRRFRLASFTAIDGALVVVISWIVTCLVSAVPVSFITGLGFSQSVFESVSGWTTTGLSVVDVITAPRVLLMYRSIIQLAGGAGLVIIMLAAVQLPVGAGLYRAEGRNDQLVPNIVRSTKLVVLLYLSYAALGSIAYRFSGMGWFDAINHSFAAVSTGGFSTRVESIGYWDSSTVEAVTVVLMLLGNLNFLTGWLLLHGKVKAFLRNGEVRLFAVLFSLSSVVAYVLVTSGSYEGSKAFRVALFEMATALTTTGFSTVGYGGWRPVGYMLLVTLMVVGGGSCSTAGGVKQFRIYVLYKSVVWEIKSIFLPRRAIQKRAIFHGEAPLFINDKDISTTGSFLFIYLALLSAGSMVLAAHGFSVKDSFFEMASALGTVGLSLGTSSAEAPSGVLWTLTSGMLLGRLEIFVVFAALGKIFRR